MPRRSRSRSNSRDRSSKSHRSSHKDSRGSRHSKSSRRSRTRSRSPRRDSKRSDRTSPVRSSHKTKDRYQRSPSPDYLTLGNVKPKLSSRAVPDDDKQLILDPAAFEGKTEEEIEMMKVMGFGGFDTTKNKATDGASNAFAVNIQQKRKYRQYMNRKGGFNRPLDSCP